MHEQVAVAQLLVQRRADPNRPSFRKQVPLLHGMTTSVAASSCSWLTCLLDVAVAAAHGLDMAVTFLVESAAVDPLGTFRSEKMGVNCRWLLV